MTPGGGKSEIVQQLEKQILALQGLTRPSHIEAVKTGLGAVEQAFPNQTFPIGAVHEFISNEQIDGAATNGFLAGLISCLMQGKGICVWVSTKRRIFPPALKPFGINPEQIIFVDASRDKEALWIVEEGVKCNGVVAVVGEFNVLDFTASRRLQLAVENSSVTGFIHRFQAKTLNTVACVSRWKITPLASEQNGEAPGVGFPKWNVELLKVRNGQPGIWQVEWTSKGFHEIPIAKPSLYKPVIRKTG